MSIMIILYTYQMSMPYVRYVSAVQVKLQYKPDLFVGAAHPRLIYSGGMVPPYPFEAFRG